MGMSDFMRVIAAASTSSQVGVLASNAAEQLVWFLETEGFSWDGVPSSSWVVTGEWYAVSELFEWFCIVFTSLIHQIFAHSAISHLFCFRREPSLFKCILWVPRTHAHFQQQSHCPIGYSTAHLLNYIVALECFGSLTLCSEWPLLEDVDFARVSARFWITFARQLSKKYLWDPLRCFYDAFGEVMRLARLGPTAFHFLPMAVTTSARRMLEMGPLRQQLLSLGNLGNFGNWEEHLASLVCWFDDGMFVKMLAFM